MSLPIDFFFERSKTVVDLIPANSLAQAITRNRLIQPADSVGKIILDFHIHPPVNTTLSFSQPQRTFISFTD